jgi:hypothetical protein
MSEDILRTFIYVAVIAMFPINIITAYILMNLSRKFGGVPALSERAVVAMTLGIASFAGFVLSIVRLTGVEVPPSLSIALNGVAAILIGVPSLYWLWKYKTGGFRDEHGPE